MSEINLALNFQERIAVAKSRNILEVATTLGIELETVGRTTRWKEHPSLVLYSETNRFKWFSQELSGDVLDFVQAITDMSFTETLEFLTTTDLSEQVQLSRPTVKTRKSFYYYVTEESNFQVARDYLIEERGILPEIVDRLHQEGYLKQALYTPHYPDNHAQEVALVAKWEKQGKLVGGTIQGLTIDYEQYGKRGRDKRIMANPEPHYGWNYTLGQPNKMVIAESFIDVLSYWSLHPDLEDCFFVSLEGLKEETLLHFIKELYVEKGGNLEEGMILAVDNDRAGQMFVDRLEKYQFTDAATYQRAQPYNAAIESSTWAIYSEVGAQVGISPLALASVHKAYTNGATTNELANGWKEADFFGENVKPKDVHTIDLMAECEVVATALLLVQHSLDEYDFSDLQSLDGKNISENMSRKIQRMYDMYQEEYFVMDAPPKDWNDALRFEQEITESVREELEIESKELQLLNPPTTAFFHGSATNFEAFEAQSLHPNGTAMGFGTYLTNHKERAHSYSNESYLYEVNDDFLKGKELLEHEMTLSREDVRILVYELTIHQIKEVGYPYFLSEYGELSSTTSIDEGNQALIQQVVTHLFNHSENDLDLVNDMYEQLGGDAAASKLLGKQLTQLGYTYAKQETQLDTGEGALDVVVFDADQLKIVRKEGPKEMAIEPFTRTLLIEKLEEEQAFLIAEKELDKRKVSADISSEKVVDLIKQYQQQEKMLKEKLMQQQEKVQDFQAIVQLLDSFDKNHKEKNVKLDVSNKQL
ncbi:hypothetical protein BH739_04680 [Enterococcus casseliflavus]|nr:hypothetical protein BH739_04680 [Enterococcus casseliflavus]